MSRTHNLSVLLLLCIAGVVNAAPTSPQQTSSNVASPEFCRTGADAPYGGAAQPTSMVWGGNMVKVYHNLYHHNKRWYAVVDHSSNASSIDAGISTNTQLVVLPMKDSNAFQANLQVCFVPGVTLLVDFPFPAFPDNLGHWAELLLPMYSVLSSPSWTQLLQGQHKLLDRLLLVNVKPELIYNWPKEMLALTLDSALPPWELFDSDLTTDNNAAAAAAGSSSSSGGSSHTASSRMPWSVPWDKPLPNMLGAANLSNWTAQGWMVFENVVVIQDRYEILSMPDRQLPQPPSGQHDGRSHSIHAVYTAAGKQAAGEAPAAPAAAAASDVFWASKLQVGFNRPGLAEQFRAAASARHLWGPALTPKSVKCRSCSSNRDADSSKDQQCVDGDQQQLQKDGTTAAAPAAGGDAAARAANSTSQGLSTRQLGSALQRQQVPKVVTVLLYPEDYPPVVNHYELVNMLEEITNPFEFQVRTVSLTTGAPFLSHMATVADTGLLITRHGPLLATAMLLPPGAAVLELLPYKWEWRSVSSLYYNMTQSTGYLHHWAWRPLDAKWCKYKEPAHTRYAGWTAAECHKRDCLMVHAQAGLLVDVEAVRELLARKLPGLVKGFSVQELQEPWPPAE